MPKLSKTESSLQFVNPNSLQGLFMAKYTSCTGRGDCRIFLRDLLFCHGGHGCASLGGLQVPQELLGEAPELLVREASSLADVPPDTVQQTSLSQTL